MSVQTQIDRISGAVQSALAALTEKGVTVPPGTKVDGLAALIAAIEAGGGGGGVSIGTATLVAEGDKVNIGSTKITHDLGSIPNHIMWMIIDCPSLNTNGYVYGYRPCGGAYITNDSVSYFRSGTSSTSTANMYLVPNKAVNNALGTASSTEIPMWPISYEGSIPNGSTILWIVW